MSATNIPYDNVLGVSIDLAERYIRFI